ncbi:OmpP1/FadL family transporter [Motilimonas pumila]|uniref:Aromatic hydrocarbon degradation protein n=1 Tax=Motilimonas pumila TaxID=2303987 RepID=A0A418YFV5_9GAMM|nr:outer membrane protein transport protein [Motilimonas pumila]RJG48421.1 aromatic hydrocarbon degradation protein [Motilimonas pumila]
MQKTLAPWAIFASLISLPATGAGLSLSQMGTAESLATAGVTGVVNNRDSSAVVTNPAGLTGIDDYSYHVGLQYLDLSQHFEGDQLYASADSTSNQLLPHLSYAKRINDDWVAGIALHAPGGLGLEYASGALGGVGDLTILDESAISAVNLTASVGYQVNEQLSLGASLIGQYSDFSMTFFKGHSREQEVSDSDFRLSFSLGAQYQIDKWLFGLTYSSGTEHKYDDLAFTTINGGEIVIAEKMRTPRSVVLGAEYALTPQTHLSAKVNWEQWSRFGDSLDRDYQDTFGIGAAVRHDLGSWTLMAGASYDSSPIDSASQRTIDLALDEAWRIGVGAETQVWGDKTLGIAYQYSDLGEAKIDGVAQGSFTKNRLHFITASLKY